MRAAGERMRQGAQRAPATSPSAVPAAGEVWTVSPAIKSATGQVLEHSKLPLLVVVLQRTARVYEVAPVSFETEYAGDFDVLISSLLERPAVIETWLRMPVTRRALQKPADRLTAREFDEVKKQARRVLHESGEPLTDDDPRRAYRLDERLRVIFAMAGTGEELQLPSATSPAAGDPATEKALRLKRGEVRWRREEADTSRYPRFARGAVPAGRSNTPDARS